MFPLRTGSRAFHYRPPPPKKPVVKPSKIFLCKQNAEPNTAFIRVGGSHDFLRSPVEAFALIRDVERRFGPIQDFHFQRDFDQNTRYQSFVCAAFKDPASYQRLPSEAREFTFKRPSANSDHAGGIGLEDLEPFLAPQTSPVSESENLVSDENTIPYIITRSTTNLFSPSMYTKVSDVSSRTARLYLEWGGFRSLKPISSEADLRIENAFGPTSIDNFRMRCALRRYSEMISVPNPYEVVSGQEIEPTLQEQEVPLESDVDLTLQNATMSNDVQVKTQMSDGTTSPDAAIVHPPTPPQSAPPPSTPSLIQPKPDATLSSTLKPSPPSDQPETSAQEPIETSPSPSLASPPLSTQAKPSTTLSESLVQTDAIATKMKQQAKSMNRAKQKKEERKKERRDNPLPTLSKKKPAQPSMKGVNKGAGQAANEKRKAVEEKPKTVREKISGFFSSFF